MQQAALFYKLLYNYNIASLQLLYKLLYIYNSSYCINSTFVCVEKLILKMNYNNSNLNN